MVAAELNIGYIWTIDQNKNFLIYSQLQSLCSWSAYSVHWLCNILSQYIYFGHTHLHNWLLGDTIILTRKCFTAGHKKWSSAFYVPLSWKFTPKPQTTNLVVCICGGGGWGEGKLPNTLVVYLKLPIW